jgi:hypothetical protein
MKWFFVEKELLKIFSELLLLPILILVLPLFDLPLHYCILFNILLSYVYISMYILFPDAFLNTHLKNIGNIVRVYKILFKKINYIFIITIRT